MVTSSAKVGKHGEDEEQQAIIITSNNISLNRCMVPSRCALLISVLFVLGGVIGGLIGWAVTEIKQRDEFPWLVPPPPPHSDTDMDMTYQGVLTEKELLCNAPLYLHLHSPATCQELTQDYNHTNGYWDNHNFLCRTNKRPCDSYSGEELEMYINDNLTLKFTINHYGEEESSSFDFGSAEAWHVKSLADGTITNDDIGGKYKFWSENHWRESPGFSGDLNDYAFGSMRCRDPPQEGCFVFIVIDGVLVDSCPKYFAMDCRNCTGA